MQSISLVLPHQLFQQHPALQAGRPVVLIEEYLFFKQYAFHQQKIALHRASMQFYQHWLLQHGYTIKEYIEVTDERCDIRKCMAYLATQQVSEIHLCDVTDDWLRRRITKAAAEHQLTLVWYNNPNFITQLPLAKDFFSKKKIYFQTDFYIWQRKRLNLLLDAQQKPLGGQWTFDADNREKFPKQAVAPIVKWPSSNEWYGEAKQYVNTHFAHHYGELSSQHYPCTFAEAEAWLQQFLAQRFAQFGVYEDAMVQRENILHHSVLTPMLNIGLLQPQQVMDATLQYASNHDIPLNSLEGFVRQIVGWREFIRMVYELEGRQQRTRNYWGFTRKIPERFWTGTTGIHPIDVVIKKTLQTGYNHHIERLMVLGNFFLLCEFDPNEVYRWFMEMYVDAYDWVMVPSVYGMTQFADGGLMTTKPYISGSNYLLKMGDWNKGEWQPIWDALFWRFMHVHRGFFTQNPRLGMLVKTFDKMSADKQQQHLQTAEQFLQSLDAR